MRWLYRCIDVEKEAGQHLVRYRKKWFPPDDVSYTHSEWNTEKEVRKHFLPVKEKT